MGGQIKGMAVLGCEILMGFVCFGFLGLVDIVVVIWGNGERKSMRLV